MISWFLEDEANALDSGLAELNCRSGSKGNSEWGSKGAYEFTVPRDQPGEAYSALIEGSIGGWCSPTWSCIELKYGFCDVGNEGSIGGWCSSTRSCIVLKYGSCVSLAVDLRTSFKCGFPTCFPLLFAFASSSSPFESFLSSRVEFAARAAGLMRSRKKSVIPFVPQRCVHDVTQFTLRQRLERSTNAVLLWILPFAQSLGLSLMSLCRHGIWGYHILTVWPRNRPTRSWGRVGE